MAVRSKKLRQSKEMNSKEMNNKKRGVRLKATQQTEHEGEV